MRLRKLKLHAEKNIHLYDPQFQISMEEAEALAAAVDIDAIFREIAQSSVLDREDKTMITNMLAAKTGKTKRKTGRMRLAVATAIFIILITSFFSFVPIGKAWAKSIAEFFVRFFNNAVVTTTDEHASDTFSLYDLPEAALPQTDESGDNNDISINESNYATHAEFEKQTGEKAVSITTFDRLELTEILFKRDRSGNELWTYYLYNGMEINSLQSWNQTAVYNTGNFLDAITLDSQHTIYCYQDPEDLSVVGYIQLESNLFSLWVPDGIDIKAFVEYIQLPS